MISKLGVGILFTIVTLFIAIPTQSFAVISSGDAAKIKKYLNQLKKLPVLGSPASQVSSLVKKLSKLDPLKAHLYHRTGLTKLARTQYNKLIVIKTASDLSKIVKKSTSLTKAQIKKIIKIINRDQAAFIPTPTPYQGMLLYERGTFI